MVAAVPENTVSLEHFLYLFQYALLGLPAIRDGVALVLNEPICFLMSIITWNLSRLFKFMGELGSFAANISVPRGKVPELG